MQRNGCLFEFEVDRTIECSCPLLTVVDSAVKDCGAVEISHRLSAAPDEQLKFNCSSRACFVPCDRASLHASENDTLVRIESNWSHGGEFSRLVVNSRLELCRRFGPHMNAGYRLLAEFGPSGCGKTLISSRNFSGRAIPTINTPLDYKAARRLKGRARPLHVEKGGGSHHV